MVKNIVSNWAILVISVIATYFLVPFNLRLLGDEQYGLWLIISAFTSYLGLLQMGVPMASVRFISQAIAVGDTQGLLRVVSSCTGIYLMLCFLIGIVGLPFLMFFLSHYTIAPKLLSDVRWAFVISLCSVALGFVAQVPNAILDSHREFVPKNVMALATVVAKVALNIVGILWFSSLVVLALVQLVAVVVEMAGLWLLVRVRHREIRLRPTLFSFATLRPIFAFGIFALLLALGSQLAYQAATLVIGYYMTAADVPYFALPNSLIVYLIQFVVGIGSVAMPTATNLSTLKRFDALRDVFHRWTILAIGLCWPICLFFLVFGNDFMGFWVGGQYETASGNVLKILILSCLFFLPVRAIALPMLLGVGEARTPTIAVLCSGGLSLVLSIPFVRWYGLYGVAWAVTIPMLLLAFTLLVLACRHLGIPVGEHLRRIYPSHLLVLVISCVVLTGLRQIYHPRGFVEIFAAGLLTLASMAALWAVVVVRRDPVVMGLVLERLRGRATT